MHYRAFEFLIRSDFQLPISAALGDEEGGEPIVFTTADLFNAEFSTERWLGCSRARDIRAYDVGDGILVCEGDSVRMLVDRSGARLRFDFDGSDIGASTRAGELGAGLGLSLAALLRGDLPLRADGVELDGRFLGVIAPPGVDGYPVLSALLGLGARFGSAGKLHIRADRAGVTVFSSFASPTCANPVPCGVPVVTPSTEGLAAGCLSGPRYLAALFLLQPLRDPLDSSQRARGPDTDSARSASSAPTVAAQRLSEGDALAALMANTDGLWASAALLNGKRLVDAYGALLRAVPVFAVSYNCCGGALRKVGELIRREIRPDPVFADFAAESPASQSL